MPSQKPSAILADWPHHPWEAIHHHGFPQSAWLHTGSIPLLRSKPCSTVQPQKELNSHGADRPAPSALGKSSMAKEHQGKSCPGLGSVPTLVHTLQSRLPSGSPPLPQSQSFSPTTPQEMVHFLQGNLPLPPPSGSASWSRSTRASPARPWGLHLHHKKEKHKQDEEAHEPFPVAWVVQW